MAIHKLYRNGRLYDSMDTDHYATVQVARLAARIDFPNDTIELKDENGDVIYSASPVVTKSQSTETA